ncbi:hypothetical protein HDK64DRAFT_304237 [Phyllosticta capitalensis]
MDEEFDFDDFWKRQQRDSKYKLTEIQCGQKTAVYKEKTAIVKRWLRRNARAFNWARCDELEAWDEALRHGGFATRAFRDSMNDDKKSLQDYRSIAELLEGKVVLPPDLQKTLEECIKLRRQVNLHYTNKQPQSPEEEAENESHAWFITALEYILEILRDRREAFAICLHELLEQMYYTTGAVMAAWRRYKSTKRGLMQATLITYASVETARDLEAKFKEKMLLRPQWTKLLGDWYHYRDYALLDVEGIEFPRDLSTDVRVLLGIETPQPIQKSTSGTTRRNLNLLHFPATYVLDNYRAISEVWKQRRRTGPLPGYPIDLSFLYDEHIQPGAKQKGRSKRRRDQDEERNRKNLKTAYEDQIKTTWSLLNEMKTLDTYQLADDPETGGKRIAPVTNVNNVPINITDWFTEALQRVVRDTEPIDMATSFSLQLLARISQLFNRDTILQNGLLFSQTYAEVSDFTPLQEKRFQDRRRYDFHNLLNNFTLETRGEGLQHHLKEAMLQRRAFLPEYYSQHEWKISGEGGEEIHVRGNLLEIIRIPNTKGLPLHKIDSTSTPRQVDVTWYYSLDQKLEYIMTQLLCAPVLGLQRRIAEYQADSDFAENNFSLFTFVHLLRALSIMEPDLEDARMDKVIIRNFTNWFPTEDGTESAAAYLDFMKSNVPKDGDGWKYSKYTDITWSKPAGTLAGLLHGVKGNSVGLFASQLERHVEEIREWEDVHTNRDKRKTRELRQKVDQTIAEHRQVGLDSVSEFTWEKLVDVITEGLPQLPCCDVEVCFYDVVAEYYWHLRKIGEAIGCVANDHETTKHYHTRLLFKILEDFASKEKESQEAKARGDVYRKWRSKTHLSKVKLVLQSKNQFEKEREEKRNAQLSALRET